MDDLNLFPEAHSNLNCLFTGVKCFSEYIRKDVGLGKCAKVTSKKWIITETHLLDFIIKGNGTRQRL